jgi:hypothetical protein
MKKDIELEIETINRKINLILRHLNVEFCADKTSPSGDYLHNKQEHTKKLVKQLN